MNKALMISIQPQHAVNILNGKKTLELRTWIPKGYVGWVYVYVSKANKNNGGYLLKQFYTNGDFEKYITSLSLDEDLAPFSIINGLVVFRFWFDEYEEITIDYDLEICTNERTHETLLKQSCVDYNHLNNYFMNENGDVFGYAWHIKKLEVFDEPKHLSEFYVTNKGLTYKYIKEYEEYTNDKVSFRLKKAPQRSSWIYVEDKE